MSEANHKNIVVVGAGIISTSVATMLSKVSPNWHIDMFERLEGAGIESSNENNNAGTGHAALCELNYTVENTSNVRYNRIYRRHGNNEKMDAINDGKS